jgi:transcription factor Ssl1
VSAPHLARSYHYLFPIKHFKEEQYEGVPLTCYACQKSFNEIDKKVNSLELYIIKYSYNHLLIKRKKNI